MKEMEGRAEALASTFNEQDVANTPVHDGQTSPHKPRLFKLSKHHQYPDVRMRPEMTPIVCTLMVKDLLNLSLAGANSSILSPDLTKRPCTGPPAPSQCPQPPGHHASMLCSVPC